MAVEVAGWPVRWGVLNTCLLADCNVSLPEEERGRAGYRAIQMPAPNDEIVPGVADEVRLLVAERDFPPGNHYFYDAVIFAPMETTWPVLVVLEGERVRGSFHGMFVVRPLSD